MWTELTALVLIAVLAGACVGSVSSDLDLPRPGDNTIDDDYPEDEQEIRAGREATARADLLLTVSRDGGQLRPGDMVDLVFRVTSLDSDFVNAPKITLVLPPGVSVPDPRRECELSDRSLTCQVSASILSESGVVPVSADPFEISVQVASDASPGKLIINAVVESLDNPVDNDPDPSNNRVVVELDVK